MTDSHLHTTFSFDGKQTPDEAIAAAKARGLDYVAVTDHLNCDYPYSGYGDAPPLDLDGYYKKISALRRENEGQIEIGFGVECGYLKAAENDYLKILKRYPFDVILNSVHIVNGREAYFAEFFDAFPDKHAAYASYLEAVRQSLDAPYPYDIVTHIGYVQAHAPYPDGEIYLSEFGDLIDDILKTVVQRDKCLEINTHIVSPSTNTMPNYDIMRRYFSLGGRKISFASDAHTAADVARNYAVVAADMKQIGFDGFTYFKNRKPFVDLF